MKLVVGKGLFIKVLLNKQKDMYYLFNFSYGIWCGVNKMFYEPQANYDIVVLSINKNLIKCF